MITSPQDILDMNINFGDAHGILQKTVGFFCLTEPYMKMRIILRNQRKLLLVFDFNLKYFNNIK